MPAIGVQMKPADTATLITEMQRQALDTYGIPLFISLDQEGGHASALNSLNGGTDTPGSMALGQARDPKYTFDSFDIMGKELNALGFNMDFAPVLDILPDHMNGAMNTRGFSDEPEFVAELAPAAVWGLQNHRILGTIKHMPGVGLTSVDSHKDLPVVEINEEEFYATTFLPFQRAIENGADAIMTGHIIYTAIDKDYAASMSRILLRDIVRNKIGYEGLIVTDSVGMAGAIIGAKDEDPTVRAIIAGNDMVLQAGTEYSGAAAKIANIITAVKDGRISESGLDAAVRRILTFKMKYCAFETPFPDINSIPELVGTQENIARSQSVADHTIVLYRKENGVLPLSSKQKLLFIGPDIIYNDPGSGWANIVDRTMGDVLDTFSQNVIRYEVPLPPPMEAINEYLGYVEDADVIIIATINAHYSAEQREFFAPLFSATDKPIILLTLGVPYDAWDFPEAGSVLNVTGQRSVSLISAGKVLFGKVPGGGQSAVNMEQISVLP